MPTKLTKCLMCPKRFTPKENKVVCSNRCAGKRYRDEKEKRLKQFCKI